MTAAFLSVWLFRAVGVASVGRSTLSPSAQTAVANKIGGQSIAEEGKYEISFSPKAEFSPAKNTYNFKRVEKYNNFKVRDWDSTPS